MYQKKKKNYYFVFFIFYNKISSLKLFNNDFSKNKLSISGILENWNEYQPGELPILLVIPTLVDTNTSMFNTVFRN